MRLVLQVARLFLVSNSYAKPMAQNRRINSRAIGIALVALLLVLFLAQPLQRYFAQRAQINALKANVAASQERVKKAQAELERWNDPDFIKAQARERLHFVMPGETQYIVIDPTQTESQSLPVASNVSFSAPWYQRIISSIQNAAWQNG